MFVILVRIVDGSFVPGEVLEINQNTFIVIEIPKEVDLSMNYLSCKWLDERNFVLDSMSLAIGVFQPTI